MPVITMVPIKTANITDIFVQMSRQTFKLLQLEARDINIYIGKKMMKVTVQTVEMNSNQVHFPEFLFHYFSLPIQLYKFHAHYQKDVHTLFLGPVIGLVTDLKITGTEEPHFRSIHSFCEELHQGVTENGGFFYIFSYLEFSVRGYYFDGEKWNSGPLPLPDVIYNRIHSRTVEFGKKYHLFRQKLAELNIPIF